MTPKPQLALGLEHRPSLSGQDFLVAPANANAIEWIDRWPNWPAHTQAISGPPGSGKTHLAHVFQARSRARLVTAEQFGRRSVRELVEGSTALVIDDAGETVTCEHEEALFHLLNILRELDKTMLVLSSLPPTRWNITLPDLRSRLSTLPHVAIGMPDEALLYAVVAKLFHDRQLRVDHNVVEYLLTRMERSFTGAGTLVRAIDEAALAEQRKITIPFVRDILQRMIP